MKSMTLRSAITAIICSLSYTVAAYADPKAVDVPAGDLIVALESLAKQSGVEFVYQSSQLKGLRTEGVKGAYEPKDAISLLLKGTPLTVRTDETGAIMIAPRRVERPAKSTSALIDQSDTLTANRIELEEIVVTGSHIRGSEPAGSKVTTLTREEISRSGYGRVEDVITTLTQNFKGGSAEFNQGGVMEIPTSVPRYSFAAWERAPR